MLPDAPLDGSKVEVLALTDFYRLGHCSSLPSGSPLGVVDTGTNSLAPTSPTKPSSSSMSFSTNQRPARPFFKTSHSLPLWRSPKSSATQAASFRRQFSR